MKHRNVTVLIILLLGITTIALGTETQSTPSVVEAYGYSSLEEEKSLAAVHREALADALQNAVIQTHTVFDIEAQVEGMQIKDKTILAQSLGYVKNSHVLEAGFLPEDSSIYRIRLKAVVFPLEKTPAE